MNGLVEFLLACIADDEALARDTEPLMPGAVFDHDVTGWWQTARVLAECKARRRIIAEVESRRHDVVEDGWYTCAAATEERDGGECVDDARRGGECDCGRDRQAHVILTALAAPYADDPGFRPEWRA